MTKDFFERIRSNQNTTLDNQKHVSVFNSKVLEVLNAVETTIQDQKIPHTATAYFAAIFPLLINSYETNDSSLATTSMSLMSVVISHVDSSILRHKCEEITRLVVDLVDMFENNMLRKCGMICLQFVLACQSKWSQDSVAVKTFLKVVSFSLEASPKVRKLAVEAVKHVVGSDVGHLAVGQLVVFLDYILKSANKDELAVQFHLVALLKSVVSKFESKNVLKLVDGLLNLLSFSDFNLSSVVFDLFGVIFKNYEHKLDKETTEKIALMLIDYKPSASKLIPEWLNACTKALICFKSILPKNEFDSSLGWNIVKLLNESLDWKFAGLANCLDILETCFVELGDYSFPMLKSSLVAVDELYSDEKYRLKCQEIFKKAIKGIGAKHFLQTLPLNLEPQNSTETSRAWLLPLLKESVTADLKYFTTSIYPLYTRMKQKADGYLACNKLTDAKVYESVAFQLMGLFPGFCLGCDLSVFLDFIDEVVFILNSVVDVRPFICHGVSNLSTEIKIDESSTVKVRSLLECLFRIYNETKPENREFIARAISSLLKISDVNLVSVFFKSIMKRLIELSNQDILHTEKQSLMEIIYCMIPSLSPKSCTLLIKFILPQLLEESNLLKKYYKVLCEVLRVHDLIDSQVLKVLLSDQAVCVSSKVKKMRLMLLDVVVSKFKEDELEFIPTLLPEVIICTKEVNEKTRNAAYSLLVTMGKRMKSREESPFEQVNEKIEEESKERLVEQQNRLDEYMQMVVAGLAATTPHMISATILSLSRLVFEFHSQISPKMLNFILKSLFLLLESKNREIVKSVLGFTKVACLSLPTETLSPFLDELVPLLLFWSSEHKNHFREKIRHLFERMIRKFGEQFLSKVPQEHSKFITNTLKRKARKKKSQKSDSESEDIEKQFQKVELDEDLSKIRRISVPVKRKMHEKPVMRDGKLVVGEEKEQERVNFMDIVKDSYTRKGQKIKFTNKNEHRWENDFEKDDEVKERPRKAIKTQKRKSDALRKGELQPYSYTPLNPKMAPKTSKNSRFRNKA